MKMTLNGKTLNYKVVDIVESYNFHIKFTSIRVQTKKLQILKTDWILYRGVAGATVLRASLPPSPGARYIVLQKNRTIYFCKKKKNVKKIEALWFESHLCAFTFLVCLTMGLEEAVWAVEFPSGAPRGGWWAAGSSLVLSVSHTCGAAFFQPVHK
jgi:hypothetical protein